MKENFKYGIAGVSTKRIASRLGISEPVIFAHFQTKENLMVSTARAAWDQLPHKMAFPKVLTAEEDHRAFLEYKEKVEAWLKKPLPVAYLADFSNSRYSEYSLMLEMMKPYTDEIAQTFSAINPKIPEGSIRVLAERFIESSITTIYHMVMGHHPHDDKTLMLYYGSRIYGMVGMLEMTGAKKPVDLETIEFDESN
jgi:AcrR family transcriptional regulator